MLRLRLGKALRALPARQREVIALHYLADLREADIAVTLGISLSTVKTHIHRGIAALRRDLGNDLEQEVLDHV